ncbi:MAG: TetR family transcriptional regulator C-terminal domain-containing protein [Vicinamibacterales bacterium]
MPSTTKQDLLKLGLELLLKHGYADLGVATLLERAGVPKGSFYHHFKSKEDFGLQAIDLYMENVHVALAAAFDDEDAEPLQQIRRFFEIVSAGYKGDGYLGCLLGGLGQELSGVSPAFRRKVEACFAVIARRFEHAFARARERGQLRADADPHELADLLVNCWEGAALRSRLRRSGTPLGQMLDFYVSAVRS